MTVNVLPAPRKNNRLASVVGKLMTGFVARLKFLAKNNAPKT